MRKSWQFVWLLIPGALLGAFVTSSAQTPPASQIKQATLVVPAKDAFRKPRDGSKLPETAQPIYFSAERAMEWLKRTNRADGRFVYGFQPALRVQIDGDNFASQAGATFALARSARYYQDRAGTAKASQAALALLLETMLDADDQTLRYLAAPPMAVDRLSAHGLLISAIHELDASDKYDDLLRLYVAEHPDVKKAADHIESVRRKIDSRAKKY